MKMSQEEKDARKEARRVERERIKTKNRINEEKNQKPVKQLTINIEWHKSRMWGNNPKAVAEVEFQDGTFDRRDGYTASGCGYCKSSTVIAEIFNDFLKYKLWKLSKEAIKGGHGSGDKGKAPYGINTHSPEHRSYAGGIGVSCYREISEYIDGKWECVASGNMFDVYRFSVC